MGLQTFGEHSQHNERKTRLQLILQICFPGIRFMGQVLIFPLRFSREFLLDGNNISECIADCLLYSIGDPRFSSFPRAE